METQIKVLQRVNEDLQRNSGISIGGSSTTISASMNENHPEVLQEQIKKLKKENALLKQEIETRFDKDKVIMQSKLSDAIREKQVLEESNQSI